MMIIAGTLIGLILSSLLFGPKILFWATGALGTYLQKKTAVRKARLLQVVEQEEKDWYFTSKDRRDSDEWENVECYTIESLHIATTQADEWNGIVGFLHPFWYVDDPSISGLIHLLIHVQQRWRRWRTRSLGCDTCDTKQMAQSKMCSLYRRS